MRIPASKAYDVTRVTVERRFPVFVAKKNRARKLVPRRWNIFSIFSFFFFYFRTRSIVVSSRLPLHVARFFEHFYTKASLVLRYTTSFV